MNVETIARNLEANPKARANLKSAIDSLGEHVSYSHQDYDRRAHLYSVLRDIENGYSGGNDTLKEKGFVWDGYSYTRPAAEAGR